MWQNPEYLEDFFETHKADLVGDFSGNMNVENAILESFEYSQEFERQLLELSRQSKHEQLRGLEEIFSPLHNLQYHTKTLGKSKAKATWLRIYALRIDRNVYIVTGGSIKLTQKMQDREPTNHELEKIESCREYLMSQGIVDIDGIIAEMES